MARKIFISSDIAFDERLEQVAQQSPLAALMWPWLLTYCDDWGRGLADAGRIRRQVFSAFPFTVEDIEAALAAFAAAGLLQLYRGPDGRRYLAVPRAKWFRYQTHIRRDKREEEGSRCPPPPDEAPEAAGDPARRAAPRHADARDVAPVRADTRACAPMRADARDCAQLRASPSPSLSPSPSPPPSPHIEIPAGEGGGGEGGTPDAAAAEPPAEAPAVTNAAVVADLVRDFWQVVPDRQGRVSDYPAIGKLYLDCGADAVQAGFAALAAARARGETIRNPVAFVRRVAQGPPRRGNGRARDAPRDAPWAEPPAWAALRAALAANRGEDAANDP